ncbi:MAG: hypothetical protein HYX44_07330 [Aquabacterium sp.]|nr:hypothetical protein [Aquabacterium sp.]
MSRYDSHQVSASSARAHHPVDQAQGMRQMFASRVLRFVPVVANASTACGGLVLERLCAAYASFNLKVLVVDASDQARPPGELAEFDLAEGIEVLSEQISYMPAKGLPLRYTARSQQAQPVAERLARCADDFLGVAQRDWQLLDPREPATADPHPRFMEMAAGLLRTALPLALSDTAFDHLMSPGAALPSSAAPVLN